MASFDYITTYSSIAGLELELEIPFSFPAQSRPVRHRNATRSTLQPLPSACDRLLLDTQRLSSSAANWSSHAQRASLSYITSYQPAANPQPAPAPQTMNNNRYNLRSTSGQQQQQQQQQQVAAPSFYPTSSTSTTMAAAAGVDSGSAFATAATATSTSGLPSALLSASLISQGALQAGQQHQQQQHPSFHAQSHVADQQRPHFISEQANSGPAAEPMPEQYQQQQRGLGGPAATAPFLQDFTLVAEAVKRVQMDAVMTEMESITL